MDRSFICDRCIDGDCCNDRSKLEELTNRIDRMMKKEKKEIRNKFRIQHVIMCEHYKPDTGPRVKIKR